MHSTMQEIPLYKANFPKVMVDVKLSALPLQMPDCTMKDESQGKCNKSTRLPKAKTVEFSNTLDGLLDQMELEEEERADQSQQDSDDEWEEIDEFDSEWSIFGSEARQSQKSSDSLGKRSRKSFEDEKTGDASESHD